MFVSFLPSVSVEVKDGQIPVDTQETPLQVQKSGYLDLSIINLAEPSSPIQLSLQHSRPDILFSHSLHLLHHVKDLPIMSLSPLNGGNFVRQDKDRTIDGGSILKRFSLEKKTAIITGAGAGIGFAVAEAYAEMGCNLALWYNSNDKAIEKAENLGKKYNVKCQIKHCLCYMHELTKLQAKLTRSMYEVLKM